MLHYVISTLSVFLQEHNFLLCIIFGCKYIAILFSLYNLLMETRRKGNANVCISVILTYTYQIPETKSFRRQ